MRREPANRPKSQARRAAQAVFVGFALAACAFAAAARDAPPVYLAEVINPELTTAVAVPRTDVVLLAGTDGTILRSNDGIHWTHALTPTSADLARLATNDVGTTLIAAGARGTLLRSADAGRTWIAARNSVSDTDLKAVVFHGPTGYWIAAGTNGRILRSRDGAHSFSEVASNLTLDFHALYVDPQTQAILIGGDQGAIGYSADGGESWQLTMIAMPEPVTPVTAFHRFGKVLLATSALGRFLTSSDDARSWDLLQSSSKAFFTDAAFDTAHGAIVLTGHNGDVLRSADGGNSWNGVELAIDGNRNFLAALHFDARTGSLLAVAQNGVLARSRDGGASWSKAAPALAGEVRGLLATNDARITAFGTGGRVTLSADAGASWETVRTGADAQLREIIATPNGRALIATGQLGAILRSTDRGANWQTIDVAWPDEHTPPDLRALVPSTDGRGLIAAGPPGAILRGDADGANWEVQHWSRLEDERAFPWLLVNRAANFVLAVEARGEMRVARKGAREWQAVTVPGEWRDFPFWQGVVRDKPGIVLVAGKGGIAARSDDDARSFRLVETGTKADLYGSFADAGRFMFLMGQDGTLLRSEDDGLTWQRMQSGTTAELRRMVREPRTGALIVFGARGVIARSDDQGRTWQVAKGGGEGVLRKAILEPETSNILIAGGQGTLLRSRNGALGFDRLDTHTTRHFASIVADPRSGDLVLVGERIVRLVRQSAR
jgi:photosystem II stability/assembly factor-like uncharacterized protein